MPPSRRLQQYAIAISITSIVWSFIEGALSIAFGAESSSRSLIVFGIQSGIEVISAVIVVWRFVRVAKPGEEQDVCLSPCELRFEKRSAITIGALLLILAIATAASASASLARHLSPDASTPALAISATALAVTMCIWVPQRYLAGALNSAVVQGEAACALMCIQITVVLFVGALIYRVVHAAWWIDSATAIVLSLFFAAEGVKMLRWACSPAFDGGCCDHRGRSAKTDVQTPVQQKDTCKPADFETCQSTGKGCCEPKGSRKSCTQNVPNGMPSDDKDVTLSISV